MRIAERTIAAHSVNHRPILRRSCPVPMIAIGLNAAVLLVTGCPPPEPSFPFVPMQVAIARVNENNAKLASAVALKGSPVDASGSFREREEARPTSFSLSGVLRVKKPRQLLLLLRDGLSGEVMQAGSNDGEYWLWVRPRINTLWWGTYANLASESAEPDAPGMPATCPATATAPIRNPESAMENSATSGPSILWRGSDPVPERMPLRPDHLIEVLGLTELPADTTGTRGPVYRPEPFWNVLIFLEYDAIGQAYIRKEYWLDRAAPFLVRQVVFRSVDGREQMHARLDGHRPVKGAEGLAAHHIRIDWPLAESWLELRIHRFAVESDELPPPENPRMVGAVFDREVCVDDAQWHSAGNGRGGVW